ncbi:MAG: hypothetical protein CVV27_00130 [Candidatus Melainabacteria bacterium HGW-Melainabacteria-1]|nr:MAG: hypothetical protein CVV27_00130 [Candidatus Melainabacteria bacterium HGW-Melainabacteria-1]
MKEEALVKEILALWDQIFELERLQQAEYERLGRSAALLNVPAAGPDRVVKIQDITLIQAEGRRCRVTLQSGESFLSNTAFSLTRAARDLGDWPQFQRVHEACLANLHHVEAVGSHPLQVRDYQLRLAGGQAVTVPETRAPLIMRWFGLDSLRKVEPFHRKWGAAYYLENLRPFPKPLRLMTSEELHQHFDHPRTGRFQVQEFMANFIWEYYQLMKRGLRPPVQGNIRTFWYLIKPVLGRAVTLQGEKHYAIMLGMFQRLVTRYKLFKFREFDFSDQGEQFYNPGDRQPQIVLLSEKTGHYRRLQALQKEFGVSIIGLGGMPSILTSEYFADALGQAIRNAPDRHKSAKIHLISITDYNPSGAIILKSFVTQLAHQGIKRLASVQSLLTPSRFSAEELQAVTEPLPMKTKADRTKAERWLAAGGGVNGQPLGIESEALILHGDRFREVFLEAYQQALSPSRIARRGDYDPLSIETTENLLQLRESQELF